MLFGRGVLVSAYHQTPHVIQTRDKGPDNSYPGLRPKDPKSLTSPVIMTDNNDLAGNEPGIAVSSSTEESTRT